MVSTPNIPGGLMDTIRKEPEDKCLYERIYLPYTVALNKLFTIDEIEQARIRVATFSENST